MVGGAGSNRAGDLAGPYRCWLRHSSLPPDPGCSAPCEQRSEANGPGDYDMRRAILWVAFLGAAVAGSDAAPAQNVAAPAAPAAASAAGPISAIHQQLKRDGYMPGVVNAVITEPTQRAIAAYERHNGP